MPRGVKGSGPAKKVAPKKKVTPKAAKPKADASPPAAPPVAPLQAAAEMPSGPLGSVDIDSLSGDALRHYAKRAGVLPRDVAGLTEDRLRQNTKLVIANHFELLTEA